jgi:hypothetical protein
MPAELYLRAIRFHEMLHKELPQLALRNSIVRSLANDRLQNYLSGGM